MTIWRIHFACRIPKTVEYLLPSQGNNGYANALQCYIMHYACLVRRHVSRSGRKLYTI